MLGEVPILICSHVPIEISLKKRENQKRVIYIRGGSRTHVFS
jgi:hypothetical protein